MCRPKVSSVKKNENAIHFFVIIPSSSTYLTARFPQWLPYLPLGLVKIDLNIGVTFENLNVGISAKCTKWSQADCNWSNINVPYIFTTYFKFCDLLLTLVLNSKF